MDNETKLSGEQINSLMNAAAQGKIDSEKLISENLNQEQAQKVRSILNDPEKLKSIMESPVVKKILASFSKKEEKE